MKKILLFLFFLGTSAFYAQTRGITYQAVIYNSTQQSSAGITNVSSPLSNKPVCLRFTITDSNSNTEYQETITTKTDEYGMVNLIIGTGDQTRGYASSFDGIVWDENQKNLQVAVDTNGLCSSFEEISNQALTAVPFAFNANTAITAYSAENVTGIVPILNGGTGATTVNGAKTNFGLDNVDNTTDLNKPISTATKTALDVLTTGAATEKSDRIAADVILTTGAAKEVTDRTFADTVLTTSVTTERDARTVADNTLTTSINTEIANRTAADLLFTKAVNDEAVARATEDTAINSKLTGEIARAGNAEGVLTAGAATEKTDRIAADVTLTTGAATEKSDRIAADVILTTGAATEKSDRIAADLILTTGAATEKSDRLAAEQILTTGALTEKSERTFADIILTTSVNTEKDARIAGDTTLSASVTAEKDARTAADALFTSSVNNEALARATEDTNIKSNLVAETTRATIAEGVLTTANAARIADIATLTSNINTEKDARINGDATFAASVITERDARIAGDVTLTTSINTEIANRTAADVLFTTRVNDEALARATEDTVINGKLVTETARATEAERVLGVGAAKEVTDRLADVNAEELARTNADIVLTTGAAKEIVDRIAAATLENTARLAAEGVLDGKITTEKNARIDGDATEKSDRLAAATLEKTDRVNAEGVLDNKITTEKDARISAVSAEALARTTAATLENTARLAAEGVLDGKITTEKNARIDGDATEVLARTNAINAEALARTDAATLENTTRVNAEGVLDSKITTEKSDRLAAATLEKTDRVNAEGVLDSKITTEKDARISAVSAEALARTDAATLEKTDRVNAEGVLDGKITTEKDARIAAATIENGVRVAAEGVLTTADAQEVTDRIAGDAAESLARTNAIAAEALARTNAATLENGVRVAAEGVLATATAQEATDRITADLLKAPLASPAFTGTVTGIDKTMVGLTNVDDTTDLLKPISTATQTALDLKASLFSPVLEGTPETPTATFPSNDNQVANTAYVTNALRETVLDLALLQGLVLNDATTLLKGKIQLAGDLTGFAAAPQIANDAVDTAEIVDNAVTNAKMADDAVDTAEIKDSAVTNGKLDKLNIPLSGFGSAEADVALGGYKLTGVSDPSADQDAATKKYVDDNTVTKNLNSAKIFVGDATNKAAAVDLSKDATIDNAGALTIANDAITNVKMADDAVDTAEIVDNAVTNAKLADDAVDTAEIKASAVTNGKLDKTNIPLSGFGAASADVALGANKLTGVKDPTLDQDAATKYYVDQKSLTGVNTQTTSYTLQESDNGKIINFTAFSDVDLTINTGLSVGFHCFITQLGTGKVTIIGSATKLTKKSLNSNGQGSTITVLCPYLNTFFISGDLVP